MQEALKLIVFSLDDQPYGLPLHAVLKVFRAVEVTPLPQASNLPLLGVVNVHGEIIPVLDLRKFLGLSQKTMSLSDCFITAQIFSRQLVFVADSVLNITEYATSEIAFVDGKRILKKNNDLIFILDIEEIEKSMGEGSEAV